MLIANHVMYALVVFTFTLLAFDFIALAVLAVLVAWAAITDRCEAIC